MGDKRRLSRGIYLLPTVFTTGNLFCGFYSLIESARGRFGHAAFLIVVAIVLDGLDGRIARLMGSTSEFGVQFDSLADIVSFGVAPSFLAYSWALTPLGRPGWLMAFLFVTCAAARLARFNIQTGTQDKRHFVGLPSPAAAGVIGSVVFAFPARSDDSWVAVAMAVLVVVTAVLMISRVRFRSFKDVDLRNRRSYAWVFPIALLIVAVFSEPRYVFLAIGATYLLSGPVGLVTGSLLRSRDRAPDPSAGRGAEPRTVDGDTTR